MGLLTMNDSSPRVAIGGRLGYLAAAAVIVLLDQATKIWAHARLREGMPIEVAEGWFRLIYSRNDGGLFGYFGDWPNYVRIPLLVLLPIVAVGAIVWLILRSADEDRRTLTGLCLILGGAVGNLIDRVVRGEVVDFIDVYVSAPAAANWLIDRFGTSHWPTFNVADSAIVAGAVLLLSTIVWRPNPRTTEASCTPS